MNEFLKGLTEAEERRLLQMVADRMRRGGEYDPQETGNFWEAISEADDARLARIKEFFDSREYVAADAGLKLISHDYWFEYACGVLRETAIEQLAQEAADAESNYRDLYCEH